MDELGDICERLRRLSRALLVVLVDEHGRELARAGEAPVGRAAHTHLSHVGDRLLLSVTFDDGTSLGLVRLRAKKSHEELARVLAGRAATRS